MSPVVESLRTAGFTVVDRRRQPRLRVDQCVRMRVLEDGGENWGNATVVDCSGSGLGLRFADPLSEGKYVLIDWRDGYFVGLVRNCRPAGQSWRVGIELEHLRAFRSLVFELMETTRERSTISEPAP